MNKKIAVVLLSLSLFSVGVNSAENKIIESGISSGVNLQQTRTKSTITFSNKSDYTMTLKVMHSYGGLYSTITLGPKSSRVMSFSETSSYRLKIKARHNGFDSYHDGGSFSVTCTDREWTEGEMSFSMSVHGNGLGPKISAKEFESNK